VPAQFARLSPQPFDLCLEPPHLVGEGVDGALLPVGLGRAAQGVAPVGLIKELDESTRPAQVSLVNPPRHRVWHPQVHGLLPLKRKSEA
jgi:hypothetical protein